MIAALILAAALAAPVSCDGPGRYDVNRRAYDAGKSEPCSSGRFKADFAKPCRPSGAKFGCRTVRK